MKHSFAVGLIVVCSCSLLLWGVVGSRVTFTRGTAPSNPSATKLTLWANDSTGKIECIDSAGVSCLAAGGGGTLLDHQGINPVTLTGGEDTIYTKTLPSIAAGACVRITVAWRHTTGASGTYYNFWLGSTAMTLISSSTVTNFESGTIMVCNAPGVQNSQVMMNLPSPDFGSPQGQFTSAAVNTATSTVIKFSVSGTASEVVTGYMWTVDGIIP